MKLVTKIAVLFLLTAALLLQAFAVTPAHASEKESAYKAYYDLVKKLHKGDELTGAYDRFKLIYVDADDIPELLAVDVPSDEYENNGIYRYELYTYYDGKAVMLGCYSSGVASAGGYRGDTMYIKKSGKIYETYHASASGDGEDIVYILENGEMKETARGAFNIGNDETAVWNDKTLSAAKYAKKLNKVFNTNKGVSFESLKTSTYKSIRKKLK